MPGASLTLFHTAGSNVAVFDALLQPITPPVPYTHVVDEEILREAKAAGRITPQLEARVDRAFSDALGESALVLCTCSTIGALAERGRPHVLRVDRPMAEWAVRLGTRIAVAATLPSTFAPTSDLIAAVAAQAERRIEIVRWHLAAAWPFMERGDEAGYAAEIARDVAAQLRADRVDVVVLAQASMAGAEPLTAGLGVPVLSSPRLGLAEALRRLR